MMPPPAPITAPVRSRPICAARTILLFIAFGLATFYIWYASRAIHLVSGSVGGGSSFLNVMQQQQPMMKQSSSSSSAADASRGNRNIQHELSSHPPILRDNIINYNFTIGICAIVKDSEAYLTEWIDYHLSAMNIQSIFIYDNSKEFDLQVWYTNTRSHPLYNRVEVLHLPDVSNKRQRKAYTDCVGRFGRGWNVSSTDQMFNTNEGMDYLAFIDIDEYLVPQGNYTSVHGVIHDYLEPYTGGSLTVNWMLFGSANKSIYSPIPVLKRFQYRDETPHPVIKSILKVSDFHSMSSPHAVNTLYGYRRTTSYPGAKLDGNPNNKGGQKPPTNDPKLPSKALLLYHYRYTSAKEYHYKKCIRRETDGIKGCSYVSGKLMTVKELEEAGKPSHIALRTGSVFDDSAWRILVERVPKYGMFDDGVTWVDYT
ncbi:hypothetical protein ACHAXR_008824 [Thalassiosira sp. AJA248-18]